MQIIENMHSYTIGTIGFAHHKGTSVTSSISASKNSSNLREDSASFVAVICGASMCFSISSSPTVSMRYFKMHLTANNALYVCHADKRLYKWRRIMFKFIVKCMKMLLTYVSRQDTTNLWYQNLMLQCTNKRYNDWIWTHFWSWTGASS